MSKDIVLRCREDGVWEEYKEPHITVACPTEKDYLFLQEAVKHYNAYLKGRKPQEPPNPKKIVFQGKRVDSDEWVKGDLFHNDNADFPMVLIGHVIMSRDKHTNALSFDGYDLCEVDPETISIVGDAE